jgi:hypothetical protein
MLELKPSSEESFFWNLISVRLHIPLWGIGVLELSNNSIMLFGGSDRKNDSPDVFVLEINEQENLENKEESKENGTSLTFELKRLKTRLCEPDWFYDIGRAMKDPNNPGNLLIMGERKIHNFNLDKMEFVSCLENDECFITDSRQKPPQKFHFDIKELS